MFWKSLLYYKFIQFIKFLVAAYDKSYMCFNYGNSYRPASDHQWLCSMGAVAAILWGLGVLTLKWCGFLNTFFLFGLLWAHPFFPCSWYYLGLWFLLISQLNIFHKEMHTEVEEPSFFGNIIPAGKTIWFLQLWGSSPVKPVFIKCNCQAEVQNCPGPMIQSQIPRPHPSPTEWESLELVPGIPVFTQFPEGFWCSLGRVITVLILLVPLKPLSLSSWGFGAT